MAKKNGKSPTTRARRATPNPPSAPRTARAAAPDASARSKKQPGARKAGHLRDLASVPARAAEVVATDQLPEIRNGRVVTPPPHAAGTPSSAEPAGRRPAVPIGVVLHDARELFETARRTGTRLVRGGLDPKLLKELPHRIALVADAQKAWEQQARRSTPVALRAARDEAAALKTEMLAAGRYVLRKDLVAQRELDAIVEGDGLDDLINDLRTLADFYERRADMLDHADVPDDAVARARDLATRLRLYHEKAGPDPREQQARAHRNRALARLEEAVTEVRAAGRYVFRDAPARLALFRHEFKRVHDERVAAQDTARKKRGQ